MENPNISQETTASYGGSKIGSIISLILTLIGIAGTFILPNFISQHPNTQAQVGFAAILALLSLTSLVILIVGITLLCVFSPLKGRRILWLFFLSQWPITLLGFYQYFNQIFHLTNVNSSAAAIIEIILFLVALFFTYFLAYRAARKYNVIPAFHFKYIRWGRAVIAVLIIYLLQQLFSLMPGGNITTSNQDTLNQLANYVPFFAYVLSVVSAGFFEELVFRVGSYDILFPKRRVWAFIMAAVSFTLAHGPLSANLSATVYGLMVYGSMAILLTWFYDRYHNFYLNMTIHALWNLSATVLLPLILPFFGIH